MSDGDDDFDSTYDGTFREFFFEGPHDFAEMTQESDDVSNCDSTLGLFMESSTILIAGNNDHNTTSLGPNKRPLSDSSGGINQPSKKCKNKESLHFARRKKLQKKQKPSEPSYKRLLIEVQRPIEEVTGPSSGYSSHGGVECENKQTATFLERWQTEHTFCPDKESWETTSMIMKRDILVAELSALFENCGIGQIPWRLFGSRACGLNTPKSDVDLVQFLNFAS